MSRGGGSGIGAAIARRATAAGGRVAITGRDGAQIQQALATLPGVRAYVGDVRSLASMQAACAAVVADFGRIDGLVNNAGIGGVFAPLAAASLENWDQVLATNLTGVFNTTQAALAHMLPAGGGAIVNMGSLSSILAEKHMSAYIAAKHAVVGLTKATALDHARDGIRCNAICPSFIRTPMTEADIPDPAIWEMIRAQHPTGRLVTAEEVAEITVFLLSDRASGMNAGLYLADSGIAAV